MSQDTKPEAHGAQDARLETATGIIEATPETPARRPDASGIGYIDDPGADGECEDDKPTADGASECSDNGSSMEEDSEDEGGGWPLEESEFLSAAMAAQEDFDDDDEDLDWGVENEDWELADGDFTKQYNRVRQSYGAAQGTVAAPLPARNVHQPRKVKAAPATAGTVPKTLVSTNALGGVAANPKSVAENRNQKDKADRATHEQVLDSRTRLVLSALVNRGFFALIDGCVSTGKEANVYLAHSGDNHPAEPFPYPAHVAVKIYRTSILNFRARQNYIVGEHRFRGGYASAKNPRKMVRLWAEKELRNLRRLVQGGVRAPIVIEQRENVLVMEFLGNEGTASPRLKDAEVSISRLSKLYGELLVAMRRMYHVCHLVHADLSEYNILYHASHVYIIDVSQSVEHDHPSAFDFLRSDIRNVEDFFHKRSSGEVRTLGVRRAWSFIVDESVGLTVEEEAGDDGEERLLDVLRARLEEPEPMAAEVDDAVFMKSYIPRSLGEVYDPERDIDIMKAGGSDKLIYAGITGLSIHDDKAEGTADAPADEVAEPEPVAVETKKKAKKAKAEPQPKSSMKEDSTKTEEAEPIADSTPQQTLDEAGEDDAKAESKSVRWADEQDDEDDDGEDEDDAEPDFDAKPRGFRHEDKESKKERKKALKEENREKRKHKMPKGEKARLIKKSSGRG